MWPMTARIISRLRAGSILVATVGALLFMLQASAAQASESLGVWRNPKNSVHVEIRSCGAKTCGYVVWASEKAKRDAREGGTENLIGLQLFRDFEPRTNGVLHGRVFVPDLNRTFSGSAKFLDDNTLQAKGCFLGNLLCKTQIWRRVS